MTQPTKSPLLTLKVKRWNAWLPGVYGPLACGLWAQGEKVLALDAEPDVTAVPPMLRRRLSGVGRLAAAVVWDLVPEGSNIPMVFCSQHGDQDRTLQLLAALGQSESLSPAAFSMSVHNSVAGVLSIAKRAKGAMTALASDEHMLSMGLIEAWGQLQTTDEVLLVIYDQPLPDIYKQQDSVVHPYALALLLSLTEGKTIELGVESHIATSVEGAPEAVQWLRWFANPLSGEVLTIAGSRSARTWRK